MAIIPKTLTHLFFTHWTSPLFRRARRAGLGLCLAWLFLIPSADASVIDTIKTRGVLLWGSDAEGGAPYVFPDPKDPAHLIGFEVDLAQAIADRLGVKLHMVQTAWDSLVPALERGDYDIAMNGLEIIPARLQRVLLSRPYYVYTLQLAVRQEENGIASLRDLKGKRVGTLAGAVAHHMLEQIGGVEICTYTTNFYADLVLGRLDAVFIDTPIAVYYGKPNPRLKFAGAPVKGGYYGIAMRKSDPELKALIDSVIAEMLQNGRLRQLYQKWDLWDSAQSKLYDFGRQDAAAKLHDEIDQTPLATFWPSLLRGAGMTLIISFCAMLLAVSLGMALALGRKYGRPWLRTGIAAYVEVYRGTPLLIQLYILYYGLPRLGVSLSPMLAAVLGLGMNYAAYEAEVHRASLEAVPRGQMEAALSLGMSRWLALKRVIFPQAFKISLPAVTNDFIALFKDSSIVSVIAMVELTKTYSILAATTLRYFELGLVVAALYFGMSYPLSLLARRLEKTLRGAL